MIAQSTDAAGIWLYPDRDVIADGDPGYGYLNMICKMGAGRDEETRKAAAEAIYAAAEAYLKPRITAPFALSLDLSELDPVTSLKRFNTIHADLKKKGCP